MTTSGADPASFLSTTSTRRVPRRTVLAQKKQAPKRKKTKEEYEGYVINAQLRRMIARSLPARDVQRKP